MGFWFTISVKVLQVGRQLLAFAVRRPMLLIDLQIDLMLSISDQMCAPDVSYASNVSTEGHWSSNLVKKDHILYTVNQFTGTFFQNK